ncbi:DNA-binding protein [Acinetobacter gyllenbergii]|nr:DNA-binding protein [Acinetobacter gyllenbergii]
MARNNQQVNIRMSHETVDELKAYAVKYRRSLTSQLNVIVEEWLKSQKERKV